MGIKTTKKNNILPIAVAGGVVCRSVRVAADRRFRA